ncbi:SIR2 family protein [Paenibacillus woosongensis]|uniref:SIR2-like domain-containing protein n=1 Tax=Paenibacillus woosongensis TaxID=307580 RepID=A0A7X2Z0V7_9BACL|nr:SIR2 family protein [Paenibacillus woosongensis]MUG45541.1 hypothetical protein [Paenibacillus woosongensis]
MSDIKQIEELLYCSQSLPFLFVGSGVSKRYINTDSWPGIIERFANIVDKSEFAYEKYENKARQFLLDRGIQLTKNNMMTKMADFVESDFNTFWFDSSEYEQKRVEFREEIRNGITPFKLEIANYFRSINMNNIGYNYLNEIALLKEVGEKSIAGVITTNYDCLMEYIFPDYEVYVGQEQLIFSPTYGVNEIYKIHGCSLQPKSIVINSSDYEDFDKRNAYLAAKLMTIFVEHPIIFLGYSLDDENVQSIIKSIVDCLSDDNLDRLRDRLIFVEWRDGYEKTEVFPYSRAFSNGKTISMTKIITDSYEELFEVLLNNKSKYSSSFYRKIRKDIYELALSEEGHERIQVLASNDKKLMEGNFEILIGFGIVELGKRGYRSISAEEVFKDILFDEGKFNNELLIKEALPELIKRTSGSLPVFKYIERYTDDLPLVFKSRFENFSFEKLETKTILLVRETMSYTSIEEVIQKYPKDLYSQIKYIQALPPQQIDLNDLEKHLKKVLMEHPQILVSGNQTIRSGIKKLIRMYDYLRYRK